MMSWILSKKLSLGTHYYYLWGKFGAFVTCVHIQLKLDILQPNYYLTCRNPPPVEWSSCSVSDMNAYLDRGFESCLLNDPSMVMCIHKANKYNIYVANTTSSKQKSLLTINFHRFCDDDFIKINCGYV